MDVYENWKKSKGVVPVMTTQTLANMSPKSLEIVARNNANPVNRVAAANALDHLTFTELSALSIVELCALFRLNRVERNRRNILETIHARVIEAKNNGTLTTRDIDAIDAIG